MQNTMTYREINITIEQHTMNSRRVYHTNVATDTDLFVVSACELCKTGFNFPTIPTPTP